MKIITKYATFFFDNKRLAYNKSIIIKSFFIIFLFPLSFSIAKAQMPFHKQFTVNDGLPSSELFDATQDHLGRIWYTSNAGVGYYNGYSFTNFSRNDGLASSSVVKIFHGKDGKLWFLSYSGKLSFYKKGKIFTFKDNNKILEYGNPKKLLRTLKVDSSDNIYFQLNEQDKICKITPDNNLQIIDTNLLFYDNYLTLFFDDRYDKKQYYQYISILNQLNTKEFIDKKKSEGFTNFTLHQSVGLNVNSFIYLINGNYYTLTHDHILKLIKIKENLNFEYFAYGLMNCYEEKNGNIWIRKINDGIYLYSKKDLTNKPVHFFNNLRVTRILKDRDGNYWVATDGDGLFLIPSFQFNIFNKTNGVSNENILSFDVRGRQLYFATNDNNIYKALIDKGKVITCDKFLPQNDYLTYGRNILCHTDGSVWIITSPFLKYDTTGKRIPLNVITKNKLYQAVELKDHSVAIATRFGFVKYIGNRIVYDSREDNFNEHIRTIFEDKKGMLWLGTMNGLYAYNNKQPLFYGKEDPFLAHRITAINECNDRLIVGTHDNGIVIINDTNYHINTSNGLKSNLIKTQFVENDSVFWVGTNNGLDKILCSENQSHLQFKSTHYSVWDGLPSNEINKIKIIGQELWIATNNGLASINVSQLKKSNTLPVVFIEYIIVNDKDTLKRENNILKYNKNNITFFYKGISFNGPGDITYKIKLNGIDKQWVTTRNTFIRYMGLPVGDYQFYVKACNSSDAWSKKVSSFSFTIQKHFTKTWWFLILMIVTGLMMLISIFLMILRNQHQKAENRRQLLLSEQKALRAQMNPHFIFNSLSSIQYLILENDFKEAAVYLSNFASLMRRVLENSKFYTISLSEEIKTLKTYLDLEKMRFDDKFDYQIIIDPFISQDEFTIPPMLIQPYLENAIWHGFMLKKTKGFLNIKIERFENKGIVCVIEDNGIGRKEAGRISSQRKNHRSTGMKNIEERIALINKIYKTDLKVTVIDLQDAYKNAKGTRVELYIPKVFYF